MPARRQLVYRCRTRPRRSHHVPAPHMPSLDLGSPP
jgi:hypothetical protein